jgi:hypothetical protein
MRTELENLHDRFLLNLNPMQQLPVESVLMFAADSPQLFG